MREEENSPVHASLLASGMSLEKHFLKHFILLEACPTTWLTCCTTGSLRLSRFISRAEKKLSLIPLHTLVSVALMNVSKPGSAKAITAGSNTESSTSCFPERKVDACVFAL